MLDFEKIQKKANLAKELVSKGIAVDLEEAYEMIERNGMINSSQEDSEFFKESASRGLKDKVSSSKPKKENETSEDKKTSDRSKAELEYKIEVLNERLIRLQERFSQLSKHFENLQTFFETKIEALEQQLKNLESNNTVHREESSSCCADSNGEGPGEEKEGKPEEPEQKEETKLDPSISIENIFNNSNNRLV